MAYNINKTDGTLLVTVADGGINAAATTIRLIGRDLTNYGEILNENLVHMMENFASSTAPLNPLAGQIWYDVGSDELKYWDGSAWQLVAGTASGTGDITNGANLGAGEELFAQKNVDTLEFKTIVEGAGMTVTSTGTEITIASSAGEIDVISSPPAVGDVLKWDGSKWVPGPDNDTGGGGGGGGTNLVGEMRLYGGLSAPAEWLICDGSAVDRVVYADLFSIIGTSYGPGDGSTTFNLPDTRGRSPLGAGTGPGLTPRSRGQEGGAETHTLTEAQMPTHTHTGGTTDSAGSHTHSYNDRNIQSGSGNGLGNFNNGDVDDDSRTTDSAGAHTHNISSIGDAGGDEPHNNMHPYFVGTYIIYTGV